MQIFRQLVTTSLNINAEDDDEVRQPLSLEFDYENGSYRSFPKVEGGQAPNYKPEGNTKSSSTNTIPATKDDKG